MREDHWWEAIWSCIPGRYLGDEQWACRIGCPNHRDDSVEGHRSQRIPRDEPCCHQWSWICNRQRLKKIQSIKKDTDRKCPTCISLAMLGDEKSMTTFGAFFCWSLLWFPTMLRTLGGRTPFKRSFRICSETNAGETVMLIKPGPENSI